MLLAVLSGPVSYTGQHSDTTSHQQQRHKLMERLCWLVPDINILDCSHLVDRWNIKSTVSTLSGY